MSDEFKIFQRTPEGDVAWSGEVALNVNDYLGRLTLRFAARWASLMEKEMVRGRPLAEVWERMIVQADRPPAMSGTTQAAAVSILGRCWTHGPELLRLYWPDEPDKWVSR